MSDDKFKEADIWKSQPEQALTSLATLAAVSQIVGDKLRMNGPSDEPLQINGLSSGPVAKPSGTSETPDMGAVAAEFMVPVYSESPPPPPKRVGQPAYRTETGALLNFRTQAIRMVVAALQKTGHKHITKSNLLSDRTVSKFVERVLQENLADVVNQPDDGHRATKLKMLSNLTKELLGNRGKPQSKQSTKRHPVPKRRRR